MLHLALSHLMCMCVVNRGGGGGECHDGCKYNDTVYVVNVCLWWLLLYSHIMWNYCVMGELLDHCMNYN